MKNWLILLFAGLLLLNCKSDAIEKPDNLVDEDKMVDVMYDLYLLNAIKSANINYLRDNNITSANYVYQKYNIDSLQFSQSDLYYAANIEEYEKLYQLVTMRLQENKATIDSLLANSKNGSEVKKVEKKTVGSSPVRNRDSLRKRRFNQIPVLKDSIRN